MTHRGFADELINRILLLLVDFFECIGIIAIEDIITDPENGSQRVARSDNEGLE